MSHPMRLLATIGAWAVALGSCRAAFAQPSSGVGQVLETTAFKPGAPSRRPTPPPPVTPVVPHDPPTTNDTTDAAKDVDTAVAGGITAEQVGVRAAETSYQAKAAAETAESASARADGQWTNFIPRVGLKASYARLSNFTPPTVGAGAIVATSAASGTVNPQPLIAEAISFPLVLNNWLTQATIAVPISDYFLKINEGYTAALAQTDAARYDVETARAKSYADGKIAYYTWLRARSSLVVAEQSLAVAKAHEKDAANQVTVGNASRGDVLRAQTQAAAAELGVERGRNGVIVAERRVRLATHAKETEKLEPGESLEAPLPSASSDAKALLAEAVRTRPELKSLDKNAEAARKLANVARNGGYPSLSGFGDVTYANPNQRIFPQRDQWFPTWAIGAQVTWSTSDLLSAGPAANDAVARANALDAQRETVRDEIELEVVQTYQSMLEADVAITSTARELESAEEAYRVTRQLFTAGRATSTTLIDAETALAQARFENLNGKVDARVARIRLDHAIGRDVGK